MDNFSLENYILFVAMSIALTFVFSLFFWDNWPRRLMLLCQRGRVYDALQYALRNGVGCMELHSENLFIYGEAAKLLDLTSHNFSHLSDLTLALGLERFASKIDVECKIGCEIARRLRIIPNGFVTHYYYSRRKAWEIIAERIGIAELKIINGRALPAPFIIYAFSRLWPHLENEN